MKAYSSPLHSVYFTAINEKYYKNKKCCIASASNVNFTNNPTIEDVYKRMLLAL